MSGRQEEESDKASMCEWGIWREFREKGISVAVRTGERHEVSEKVCMRQAGMPNPESSDGDFVATGGHIGRRPRERGIFDLDENV